MSTRKQSSRQIIHQLKYPWPKYNQLSKIPQYIEYTRDFDTVPDLQDSRHYYDASKQVLERFSDEDSLILIIKLPKSKKYHHTMPCLGEKCVLRSFLRPKQPQFSGVVQRIFYRGATGMIQLNRVKHLSIVEE